MPRKQKVRFRCGQLCVTPAVLKKLAPMELISLINRHRSGDWGDISEHDASVNEEALRHKERVISWYTASTGEHIMIVTEADRSVTTILLTDEY